MILYVHLQFLWLRLLAQLCRTRIHLQKMQWASHSTTRSSIVRLIELGWKSYTYSQQGNLKNRMLYVTIFILSHTSTLHSITLFTCYELTTQVCEYLFSCLICKFSIHVPLFTCISDNAWKLCSCEMCKFIITAKCVYTIIFTILQTSAYVR